MPVLARLPIDPALAAAVDSGKIESLEVNYLEDVAATVEQLVNNK